MTDQAGLTHALEDYLETIHEIVRGKGVARVRDICIARDVKSGSVSPAMNRLAEMGLIAHQKGEFITLTEAGEHVALRTKARHDLLTRFLAEVLLVEDSVASQDACEIEHHLSDASMDGLARLFEFIQSCPAGGRGFLSNFHGCRAISGPSHECASACCLNQQDVTGDQKNCNRLDEMTEGQRCRVVRIDGQASPRLKLLNLGLIPEARLEVFRRGPGETLEILIEGSTIRLTRQEAAAVIVE